MTNTPISIFEKYMMLRCLVAMAHADGVMSPDEVGYLTAFINRIPFTLEQRTQLEADIDAPQDINALFAQITNPAVRAQVLYFARVLSMKDGEIHASEAAILDRLQASVTNTPDYQQVKAEAHLAAQTQMNLDNMRIEQRRFKRGKFFIPYFAIIDTALMKAGIDLMHGDK